MLYQTFEPHPDLASLVSFYWTLEVPAEDDPQRQRIVPDGCIEMAFVLGDDIKRYTSEDEFIIQPRAFVLGQALRPFYIEPTGFVDTFAVSFFPYGFANFIAEPIKNLVNKETPIDLLFEEVAAKNLHDKITSAADTVERIRIVEEFLFDRLNDEATIDNIVRSTVDTLISTGGSKPIKTILEEDISKRRQLERKFVEQIGISPKQLGRVIRMQTALKMMLNEGTDKLTDIAYQSEYYDQAHFIKDFKEFTGITPRELLGSENLALSSLFFK